MATPAARRAAVAPGLTALRIQYVDAFTTVSVTELLNTVLRRVRVVESASGATR